MKNTTRILTLLFLTAIICLLNYPAFAQQPKAISSKVDIMYFAKKLQQNISEQNTEYKHKTNNVSWGDNNDYHCYTDCSGFINALIAKTYNWADDDFKTKLGHKHMLAYHYYNAIISANHFIQLKNIKQLNPGDIIALQYADRNEHEDNTGHVMLISALPKFTTQAKPILPKTVQYEVEIIDCSKSPHGKTDTRYLSNGSEYSGLGKGIFRLYTNMQGNIVAYSWSTANPKEGFNPYENPVVVGRFSEKIQYINYFQKQ